MNTIKFAPPALALALLAATPATHAFTFVFDYKLTVKDHRLTFHVDIPGYSQSGVSWNEGFEQAAGSWSMTTPIQINTVRQASDPCASRFDGIGGVGFSPDLCYQLIGPVSNTAVGVAIMELAHYSPTPYPNASVKTVDIPLKGTVQWDIYDGPIKYTPGGVVGGVPQPNIQTVDYRRVLKHELGHALGLGHSIFDSSLMTPVENDYFALSVDDICGVNVLHGHPEGCPIWLPNPVRLTGKPTTAVFVGGASNDGGQTFSDYFQRWEVIDVMATVVVEDEHWNKAGRLHVVVELSDGTTLMKTDDGFAPWDWSVEALKTTAVKTLQGANEIQILKDFNLLANGIGNVGVAMYIGYSLESEPDEIYYSGTPIMFRVE